MKKFAVSLILFLSGFAIFYTQNQYFETNPKNLNIDIPTKHTYNPLNQTPEFIPLPLSLENIFSSDHSWTATISATKKIEIIATGDVIPARSVNYQTIKYNDFTWAWQSVAEFLKSSNLSIINLEAPIISDCPITNEGMIFCGDQRHIEGLLFAGIDIANIANNHYGNYGQKGIDESNQILTSHGIDISGGENILYKELKDKTFAFLGYNEIEHYHPSLGEIDKDKIKADIKLARTRADIIVVSYHWGAEYIAQPEDYRINLARLTIDWGADLVIGNHPHWIQPVEIYKGKIINYALGNFIFDQEWSEETKQGVIAKYIFYNNQIIDVEFIPVYIQNYGQVSFAQEPLKSEILTHMYQQSQILKNNSI